MISTRTFTLTVGDQTETLHDCGICQTTDEHEPHRERGSLDPHGMYGLCIRCGNDVVDTHLWPDACGNGYCFGCKAVTDFSGRNLRPITFNQETK